MRYSPDIGTVHLVGAGPGAADLITVRGLRVLRRADVVVYDRLVPMELLDLVPESAEHVYVGKAAGRHVVVQEEINAILIGRALQGLNVVRLKGGDPFVFGRGGEEALALAGAGIPFEVIPGVSSAISVPAYAGIPVTHRGISTSFTVVTGHTCGSESEAPDWAALAKVGTLVILMGVARMAEIAGRLIEGGLRPDTPMAVIRSGTTAEQEVTTGTLADAETMIRGVRPPATIVVGEVVALREQIRWLDRLPGNPEVPAAMMPGEPISAAWLARGAANVHA